MGIKGQVKPLRDFHKVKEVIEKFGTSREQLIPILQAVQGEFRYLPQEMLSFIATAMQIPPAEVFGVATFYAQFSTEPKGKHVIQVCDGTACHVRGSAKVIKKFRELLALPGKKTTTDDLHVTLEIVSCLGACALAPAVVVDGKMYGNMKSEAVDEIVKNINQDRAK